MSGVLLDTHVALWLLGDEGRLGPEARELIVTAPGVFLSAASIWELQIKSSLGKIELPADFAEGCAAAGLQDLPVTSGHADAVDMDVLPRRDPFDAMLVAQAKLERLSLVTADRKILGADVGAVDARR